MLFQITPIILIFLPCIMIQVRMKEKEPIAKKLDDNHNKNIPEREM